MLNFDAFSIKDLSNCKTLLSLFINKNINDSKTMLSVVNQTILDRRHEKLSVPSETPDSRLCPNCNSKMTCGIFVDGLKINGCRKCRYSEVAE